MACYLWKGWIFFSFLRLVATLPKVICASHNANRNGLDLNSALQFLFPCQQPLCHMCLSFFFLDWLLPFQRPFVWVITQTETVGIWTLLSNSCLLASKHRVICAPPLSLRRCIYLYMIICQLFTFFFFSYLTIFRLVCDFMSYSKIIFKWIKWNKRNEKILRNSIIINRVLF